MQDRLAQDAGSSRQPGRPVVPEIPQKPAGPATPSPQVSGPAETAAARCVPDASLRAMRSGWVRVPVRHLMAPKVSGGLVAIAIAALVYSQYNLYGNLGRDSSIYLYGGQRFTHGVPPYASIMDPKGPMPGIINGFGVAVARLFDRSDVLVVRVEFCALSILGVLGIYLLVYELWHSAVAAVVAASVFTSFKMFAYDALTGPDGHTPGIVFIIFAMWLTVRRQWYWAGFAASLAFFSWQPLFAYPLLVLTCAAVWTREHRWRAVAWTAGGIASPLVGLFTYYAAEGYPGKFFEGTFIFPLVGVYRPPVSFTARLAWIMHDIPQSFGGSAVLLWVGLALLLVMAAWTVVSRQAEWRAAVASPMVLLLLLGLVIQVAYVLYDYIGWTHAFPLLPYAAVGFGAGVAGLLDRLSSTPRAREFGSVTAVAAAMVLAVTCAVLYYQPSDDTQLRGEKASACALQRSLAPGSGLWVIDNPIPLVLLHRANPDSYAYVGGGLSVWRNEHTDGGFHAWMAQIRATSSVVVVDYWREPVHRMRVEQWLSTHGYRAGFIGPWETFLNKAAHARMVAHSVALTRKRHDWPITPTGREIHFTGCTKTAAG